jgi:hypothetical protein
MPKEYKSAQLQIRVTPAQKATLERAARAAGTDMSTYVLNRVLPELSRRFSKRVEACRDAEQLPYVLAEINAFLTSLSASELRAAVSTTPLAALDEFTANYVAAMVETACACASIAPPPWTRSIEPLLQPYFGSTLLNLRLYLLTHSPVAFRCRNLFIDSSIGSQI